MRRADSTVEVAVAEVVAGDIIEVRPGERIPVDGELLIKHLAAWLTDGLSPRALKCTAIWLATLLIGALLSHVTGHALHIRDGERR